MFNPAEWLARFVDARIDRREAMYRHPSRRPLVKWQTPTGQPPKRAHAGDAGFDLPSTHDVTVPSGCQRVVHTGTHVSLPYGYVGLLVVRSSVGARGVRLANCVGVIDAGYTGEIKALIHNDSARPQTFTRGDRVVQLLIVPLGEMAHAHGELEHTARGAGGFGSTGN